MFSFGPSMPMTSELFQQIHYPIFKYMQFNKKSVKMTNDRIIITEVSRFAFAADFY